MPIQIADSQITESQEHSGEHRGRHHPKTDAVVEVADEGVAAGAAREPRTAVKEPPRNTRVPEAFSSSRPSVAWYG